MALCSRFRFCLIFTAMFKGLKSKWGVDERQFIVIFIVFAITGTSTAIITRYITSWIGVEQGIAYYAIKLLMLLLGYQFILLLVALPFGQYSFFLGFLKKMWIRMRIIKDDAKAIAVFASGAGSNAAKIIEHSKKPECVYRVALIVTNKPDAGVVVIAKKAGIPVLIVEKEKFFKGNGYADELKEKGICCLVLAGFLWKLPTMLIEAFPESIINIHPALLPKYGGKGMYGIYVHEAVLAAGEKESGITIHYVDGHYDNGDIILQAKCPVDSADTAGTLAEKIHQLEHAHYPPAINKMIKGRG